MKVLAAMSGGVDSAVAAARVVDAGHEVVGVHLALSGTPRPGRRSEGLLLHRGLPDARRVADVVGVPFYVWDLSERFERDVVADFVAEYAAGRTPNPCVRCNERIKFSALLDKALALGFDAVCTGHYARIAPDPATGAPALHRAVDGAKDQSYVLAVLPPDRLARALFPLGDSRKSEVRAEAARRGLRVAEKPDSHDICFITDGDTGTGSAPGSVPGRDRSSRDRRSSVSTGAVGFTVGQRTGPARPSRAGRPSRYVLEVRPVTNTVVVGPREALAVGRLDGGPAVWCGAPDPGAAVGVGQGAREEVPAGWTR